MRKTFAVLSVFSALMAAPALAQVNPFGDAVELTREDLDAMGKVGQPLLETGTLGQSAQWSNAATGRNGVTTLAGEETYKNLPCRTLKYDINQPENPKHQTYSLTWCKVAPGDWKIKF